MQIAPVCEILANDISTLTVAKDDDGALCNAGLAAVAPLLLCQQLSQTRLLILGSIRYLGEPTPF